jgi:predicted MFS family arabinose efflux permease
MHSSGFSVTSSNENRGIGRRQRNLRFAEVTTCAVVPTTKTNMKFGETIRAQKEQNSAWASFYVDYETIVNFLEEYKKEQQQQLNHVDFDTLSNASLVTSASSSMFSFAGTTHNYITTEFLISLHDQISKVVFFVLQQQGIIASELLSCQKDIQSHIMSSDGRHPIIVGLYGMADSADSAPGSEQHFPKEATLSSSTASVSTFVGLGEEEKLNLFEDRYYQIGHHLLKLYQFMNINVTGIRKLLKKHDKIVSQFHHTRNKLSLSMFHSITPPSGMNSGKNQSHAVMWSPRSSSNASMFQRRRLTAEAFGNILLQPLLHDEGLTALTASLEIRLQELYSLFPLAPSQFTTSDAPSQQHLPAKHHRNVSEPPLDCMWDTNYGSTNAFDPRSSVHTANQRSLNIPKAPPAKGGVARLPSPGKPPLIQSARTQSRKAFLQRPSMVSHRFITTSNNLTDSGNTSLSSMDGLLLQIQAARRRLHQANGYTQLLAASMMTDNDGSPSDHEEDEMSLLDHLELTNQFSEEGAAAKVDEDEAAKVPDDEELLHLQSKVRVSSILNLCSSMLYMCNYYIVAPTSASYAERLGMKASEASLIIGMTPVAALVSTVLFSWWTNHSYKSALIFASACSVLGNLCYSLGLPLNSIALVLIGRLLTGFGSARSINRRYICDTFPREERTAASAAFVTASAMGMAAGPAIASILHYVTSWKDGSERVSTLYWQSSETAPGWFMVACWLIFLLCLVLQFVDPPKKKYDIAMKKAKSMLELTHGEMKHLLNANDLPKDSIDNGDVLPLDSAKEPPIWRNIPVMTTFLIYFILKLVLEAVLSSSALITDYYFGWDSSKVGWYLALLGLLVLPANAFVAYLAQSYDDRELIIGLQVALFFGCILMMHARNVYHLAQYILGTILLVVSANALEGPNMSLLSKTIPKSWSTGIFNVGLLSTEAGTFGRAIANVALTVFGSDGVDHVLNRAFGSFSLLTMVALYISYYYYDYLEPLDHDE